MATKNSELLELLNSRMRLAALAGKKFRKEVRRSLEDYELTSFEKTYIPDLHNRLQVPYIFSTVESGLPSMFETVPDVIMSQAGKKDGQFTEFANAVWEYVKRATNLKDPIEKAGFTFTLGGMGSIRYGWETETETVEETRQVPLTDETGNPALDDLGEPLTQEVVEKQEVVVKDRPYVKYNRFDKIFFAPESEFVVDDEDNKCIPYVIYTESLSPDEVEYVYGVKVDADSNLDLASIDESLQDKDSEELDKLGIKKDDIGKISVFHYYGILPKAKVKQDWRPSKVYYICFTTKEILKAPVEYAKKPFLLLGNYGSPETFYKIGDGYVLRKLETDVSMGRSVMADYRDKLATKVAVPNGSEFDEEAFKSPKQFTFVKFIGDQYPQYITPPPVPEVVPNAISMSRDDIQMTSGQLDVARGGTSSTVDTATGQKIFSGVYEKRINRKRAKIGELITHLAKNLLVLCAEKWDVETFAKITDYDPAEIEANNFIEKLKAVGEEYDIAIEIENVVQNKEAQSAGAIAMYRELKESPLINQEELLRKVIRVGFNEVDVDKYLSGELSRETLMRSVDQLATQGLIPPVLAKGIFQAFAQEQGASQGVGRPQTQNPLDVVQNSMPAADSTQMSAQAQAAYKQTGVDKGPQNAV